ncbi:lipid-A-disaccharide synthase [Desulfogranum japonicum]|uniref:lipid-A-disaccharide synthase n=1 Tax=Desulfogranum japonicum TaxID=231447 RepID=UPI000400DE0A|nr:lipid-A-disaccharide synthase [Desulfogranum japonicum]
MDTPLTNMPTSSRHVMIVAGEASGDLHGANLIRALLEKNPGITVSGMGGRELASAGVDILFDAARIAVVGVFEVLSHLKDILLARKILKSEMLNKKPAVLILIDYPDFNMLLAKQAKALGIPVLYYISPQIWAWRKKRVHTIARLTDTVATILPFEQDFYRQFGYEVEYVGHPLLDTVVPKASPEQFKQSLNIPEENVLVGLFPGSRTKEIKTLLPIFLESAKHLHDHMQSPITFILPQASTIPRDLLEANGLSDLPADLDLRVTTEDRYTVMAACEAAVAASGTVTLELAITKTPTVICYRVTNMTYLLGRLLIRNLRFFSLVNLIADQEVLPELLQDQVQADNIVQHLTRMLEDDVYRKNLDDHFTRIHEKLGNAGASGRVADLVLEMMGHGR